MADPAPTLHPMLGRFAAAWDDLLPSQARAVLALCGLPSTCDAKSWRSLPPEVRERVVEGMREAVRLGAWLGDRLE